MCPRFENTAQDRRDIQFCFGGSRMHHSRFQEPCKRICPFGNKHILSGSQTLHGRTCERMGSSLAKRHTNRRRCAKPDRCAQLSLSPLFVCGRRQPAKPFAHGTKQRRIQPSCVLGHGNLDVPSSVDAKSTNGEELHGLSHRPHSPSPKPCPHVRLSGSYVPLGKR